MADDQQAAFSIQRIYVKDVSFESPNAPQCFLDEWDPDIKVQMDNSVEVLDENGVYDIQLKVTVTAQNAERIAYLAEVVQGGIFLITGFDDEQRMRLTGAACPNALYPYAREALGNLISKSSFPPFLVSPVNFDYLYEQRIRESQQASTADPEEG